MVLLVIGLQVYQGLPVSGRIWPHTPPLVRATRLGELPISKDRYLRFTKYHIAEFRYGRYTPFGRQ